MNNPIKWIVLVAALVALSAPSLARGGGGGMRGGGGARGGGSRGSYGGGASRPASSRGSVRNSRPASRPSSRPASRPSSRPAARPSTRPSSTAPRPSSTSARPSATGTRRSTGSPARPTQDFGRSANTGARLAAGAYLGSRMLPNGTGVGNSIQTLPAGSRSLSVGGSTYHYAAGTFYAAGARGYGVVRAPIGAVVARPLPGCTWRYWWGRRWYWYYGGVYYCDHDWEDYDDDDSDEEADQPDEVPPDPLEYEVTEATEGATLPYLPEGATAVDGQNLFVYEGTYYKPVMKDGEVAYQVVPKPE